MAVEEDTETYYYVVLVGSHREGKKLFRQGEVFESERKDLDLTFVNKLKKVSRRRAKDTGVAVGKLSHQQLTPIAARIAGMRQDKIDNPEDELTEDDMEEEEGYNEDEEQEEAPVPKKKKKKKKVTA